MVEKIVSSIIGIAIASLSLVCIRLKRKTRNEERKNIPFFWSRDHLKALFSKRVMGKIGFTICMLVLFRLGTLVTLPNIDTVGLLTALEGNPLINMMNLIGGGTLEQFSIFSLGVGPYITASIIIQMLSMDVIPYLTDLSKSGIRGKVKLNSITKGLAFVLAMLQSISLSYSFSILYPDLFVQGFSWITALYIGLLFTAGTMILIFMADQITKKGIGNGMSIFIAFGIIVKFPKQFSDAYYSLVAGMTVPRNGKLLFASLIGMFVLIAFFVWLLNTSEYRIPVQYPSSHASEKNMSYLPLKLNSASVMPVIFASSVMMVPMQIATLMQVSNAALNDWFGLQSIKSIILYGLLIIFFTFFYSKLQVNPEQLAESLAKTGAYLPGIRPGKDTEKYINRKLMRLTIFGASSLLIIALLPYLSPILWSDFPTGFQMGGTGMIIVVGVAIELVQVLKGLIIQESYTL